MNPNNTSEILVCPRNRSAFLISLDDIRVKATYSCGKEDESVLFGCFTDSGKYVQTFSTNRVFYIYEKVTGKLLSMLHLSSLVDEKKPLDQVGGILVDKNSAVIYANEKILKLVL